jgi:hypothetical protein
MREDGDILTSDIFSTVTHVIPNALLVVANNYICLGVQITRNKKSKLFSYNFIN